MREDLPIQHGITIPGNEIEYLASRSGGPGGQHANKASTRITLRWHLMASSAFSDEQKKQISAKLAHELTTEGALIIHDSRSRSQHQNKEHARQRLADKLRQALTKPKKRKKTKVPKGIKEERLTQKKQRSALKKERREKHYKGDL